MLTNNDESNKINLLNRVVQDLVSRIDLPNRIRQWFENFVNANIGSGNDDIDDVDYDIYNIEKRNSKHANAETGQKPITESITDKRKID